MAAGRARRAARRRCPTLRLRGLYFAMATLAAAEMLAHPVRALPLAGQRRRRAGRPGRLRRASAASAGSSSAASSRSTSWPWSGARWRWCSRAFCSSSARASAQRSAPSARTRSSPRRSASTSTGSSSRVAAAAGALAALGGALFAHHNTYIEPRNFDIMLGVHSLAYALIGGLGTALRPAPRRRCSTSACWKAAARLQGYRMIVFGGLVALLLIFRPARPPRREIWCID